MGENIEKQRGEHADGFLARDVADFCFGNEEVVKLLELGLLAKNGLRYVELPCQSVWIPFTELRFTITHK